MAAPVSGRINNGPGYKIVINSRALDEMLAGPQGYVVRYMIKQAEKVQAAAKKQCGYGEGHSEHGHLRDSIVKRVLTNSSGEAPPIVEVGSSHPIALIHHEGTAPHLIEANTASVLAFPGADGAMVFTAYVNHPGTSPNRYLTDNLRLVR